MPLLAQTQTWEVFNTINSGISFNQVGGVVKDNNGVLWVGTGSGLSFFDGVNWGEYNSQNSNLEDVLIKDLVFDHDGNLWIGYSLFGVAKFDGTNFVNYNLASYFNIYTGINTIHALDVDNNGNVYIGTGNGVVRYNGSVFERFITGNGGLHDKVADLKCDTINNRVWVGTYKGLYEFDGNSFINHYNMHDPSTPGYGSLQQVNRVTFDAEGDIWCTGYGVVEFDKILRNRKTVFTSNNGLEDPLVWGIAFDQNNNLWIGSDCLAGIFRYSNGNWETFNENNTNSVISPGTCYVVKNILVDENNTVWFSNLTRGLIKYEQSELASTSPKEIKQLAKLNVIVEKNYLNVSYLTSQKYRAYFSVYNLSGELVLERVFNTNIGVYTTNLDISNLSKGMYVCKLKLGSEFYSQKFIK